MVMDYLIKWRGNYSRCRMAMIRLFRIFPSALAFFLLFGGVVSGQLESSTGSILGPKVENWYNVSIDEQILSKLSSMDQSKDNSYQFALPVPVNLNPGNSGSTYHSGNEAVWVLGI